MKREEKRGERRGKKANHTVRAAVELCMVASHNIATLVLLIVCITFFVFLLLPPPSSFFLSFFLYFSISFDQDFRSKLLRFSTGSNKVPLDGFNPAFTLTKVS